MMHALVTGMNGTVAPALGASLARRGWRVSAWDRVSHPPDGREAVDALIDDLSPSLVCHVATGAPEWAGWIAKVCAARSIPLLWTGSVSVFGTRHTPPFSPAFEPDAQDDYGRYKIDCERRVLEANPSAIVARLGWQIGAGVGSNTMTDFLARAAAKAAGRVEASSAWIPSCAMLTDSAEAMTDLAVRARPGVYHLEGNRSGLSFFEIARRIARLLGEPWSVVPVEAPAMDNRMADARVSMRQVEETLAAALAPRVG